MVERLAAKITRTALSSFRVTNDTRVQRFYSNHIFFEQILTELNTRQISTKQGRTIYYNLSPIDCQIV